MSNYNEDLREGKLVMATSGMLKLILQKVGVYMEKVYEKNPEKGLSLMNMVAGLINHKVTDKEQEKGKLFLKFGESVDIDEDKKDDLLKKIKGLTKKQIQALQSIPTAQLQVIAQQLSGLVMSEDEPCWKDYRQKGMKKKGGKMVPNCVPKEEIEEVRNYRKEYDNYHSRPDQKLRRAARNTARASLKDVPEDKDVHHKDNNPLNNDKSNLSVVTQKYNRSEPRKRERDAKLKEWADSVEGYYSDKEKKQKATLKKHDKRMIKKARDSIKKYGKKEDTQEDMGTVTGPHIAGTGDDSSTVIVRKKKKMLKRMKDTIDYNKKGGHGK